MDLSELNKSLIDQDEEVKIQLLKIVNELDKAKKNFPEHCIRLSEFTIEYSKESKPGSRIQDHFKLASRT